MLCCLLQGITIKTVIREEVWLIVQITKTLKRSKIEILSLVKNYALLFYFRAFLYTLIKILDFERVII